MNITWLGHACFLLESGGYRVILDPCKGVPGVQDTAGEAEAVYCSHGHFDHCYTDEIRINEEKTSPFAVREIACFHDEVRGAKRGENTIRILTADGVTVVHLGDLGHPLSAEQLAAIGKCDVLLLPVGGTYTLDIHGAKQVADAICPRVICPMHYRRGKMGFEVLQTAEEFAALYRDDSVRWLDGNTAALNDDFLDRGGVVFFKKKMNYIRQAQIEDSARLAEIEIFNFRLNFYPIFQNDGFYFDELQVPTVIEKYRNDPALLQTTYVYDDGVVKGFIRVVNSEVKKLFVEPVLQGQAIGAKLLDFAITELDAKTLWALEKNVRAVAFYERHGFRVTGEKIPEDNTEEYLIRLTR